MLHLYQTCEFDIILHRFRDVVTLATYDLSISLIENTFTLALDANINSNKIFQPDFRGGLLALLSRFSSPLPHNSDTNLLSQAR